MIHVWEGLSAGGREVEDRKWWRDTLPLPPVRMLQDNGRAKLVGQQTFGKAVIQTVEKLQDGSAVSHQSVAQIHPPFSQSGRVVAGCRYDRALRDAKAHQHQQAGDQA